MRCLVVLVVCLANFSGCQTISEFFGGGKKDYRNVTSIPGRPADAPGGKSFADRVQSLGLEQREESILTEILKGNVPVFLRAFQAVQVEVRKPDGKTVKGTYWVAPDYLAIGGDDDFLRMPMTPMTAQKICDRFGFVVPTRKMVNDIYRQAKTKVQPSPIPASPQMSSISYYRRHQTIVELQLRGRRRGDLVAGLKKDLVNTPKLDARPLQVAIYGWHRSEGNPIQPLSLVHINTYADYSHGVRLVLDTMLIDGKETLVRDVLRDPVLHGMLSDEGPIARVKLPTTVHPRSFPRTSSRGPGRLVPRA